MQIKQINSKNYFSQSLITKSIETKKEAPASTTQDAKKSALSTKQMLIWGGATTSAVALSAVSFFAGHRINKNAVSALTKKVEALGRQLEATIEKTQPVQIKNNPNLIKISSFEQMQEQFIASRKSVAKFLQKTDAEPKVVKQFLYNLTADDNLSQKFITDVIEKPRSHNNIISILIDKIGGEKDLLKWLYAPNGYQSAYFKYIQHTAEKAKSVDDLLKISPNWDYNFLKRNFGEYTIGTLPEEFKDVDSFRGIIEKIHKKIPLENFELEKEVGFSNSGKGHAIVESDGKKYLIKFRNDLTHYDEYLAKRSEEWIHLAESTAELNALKADSTFINAQIDRYLNLNNSKHSIKMHFYDSKTQASVYEYLDDFSCTDFESILTASHELKDLKSLGLIFNDLTEGNVIRNAKNELKILDIGETEFFDVLRPGIPKYHLVLPNLCGVSLKDSMASILSSKLKA